MVIRYVVFGPPSYGRANSEPEFNLAFNRNDTYASTPVTREEAIDLLADIARHLEIDAGRPMDWADLGLTDPDDIAF